MVPHAHPRGYEVFYSYEVRLSGESKSENGLRELGGLGVLVLGVGLEEVAPPTEAPVVLNPHWHQGRWLEAF